MGVGAALLSALTVTSAARGSLRSRVMVSNQLMRRSFVRAAAEWIDFSDLAREYNEEHLSEVVSIALQASNIDFSRQELTTVKIASLTETGLILEEVLCDTAGETCIALTVPIAFAKRCESEGALRAELAEMARLREDVAPASSLSKTTCAGLLEVLNSQFSRSLELYVLRAGGVVLSESDVLERCRAVDLDELGFTLENVVCHDEGEACDVVEKRVLFNRSCQSVEEIEDALCRLLIPANDLDFAEAEAQRS